MVLCASLNCWTLNNKVTDPIFESSILFTVYDSTPLNYWTSFLFKDINNKLPYLLSAHSSYLFFDVSDTAAKYNASTQPFAVKSQISRLYFPEAKSLLLQLYRY